MNPTEIIEFVEATTGTILSHEQAVELSRHSSSKEDALEYYRTHQDIFETTNSPDIDIDIEEVVKIFREVTYPEIFVNSRTGKIGIPSNLTVQVHFILTLS